LKCKKQDICIILPSKLDIIEEFINQEKQAKLKQKEISERKLLEEAIKKVNKNVKYDTARNWLKAFKKNPQYLLELQRHVQQGKKVTHILGRDLKLTYSIELEREIYEWICFQRQNEVPLTSKDVQNIAKELISPHFPNFKASHRWLRKFFVRNDLTLRVPNGKASQKLPVKWEELASKFREEVFTIIERKQIEPKYIINMDETPLYYEYLPKKVVEVKGKKDVATWKGELNKKRCTLNLAITSSGIILKPSLILPRKTRYMLTVRNKLDMKIYGTEAANGWMDSVTMKLWLEEVIFPFVGENETLLILDSYASHYSEEVREFLKTTKINLAVIPGGLTPILQPLDYSINAIIKRYIKESSQKHQTNGAILNVEQKLRKDNEKEEVPENENEILTGDGFIISRHDQERAVHLFVLFKLVDRE